MYECKCNDEVGGHLLLFQHPQLNLYIRDPCCVHQLLQTAFCSPEKFEKGEFVMPSLINVKTSRKSQLGFYVMI